MANFTEEIKAEIMRTAPEDEGCALAFLSAFVRTSGSIVSNGGKFGFEIVTENEQTASYVVEIIEKIFSLDVQRVNPQLDMLSGRDKFIFDCVGDGALKLLEKMGVVACDEEGVSLRFGIDKVLTEGDARRSAYLKGAFLGGGSCTLPDEQTYSRTGYHFEVVFSNRITAGDFCELLCDFEVLAKLVGRKDSAVVYVKSKEVISDLLNQMEVPDSLDKLNKIVEYKDKSNNSNRVANCSVSNIDKAVTASVAQIKAIEVISQTIGLQSLDKNLFEVAEARLADPNASMRELADRLSITKSCINHRMRKIFEISSQLL